MIPSASDRAELQHGSIGHGLVAQDMSFRGAISLRCLEGGSASSDAPEIMISDFVQVVAWVYRDLHVFHALDCILKRDART